MLLLAPNTSTTPLLATDTPAPFMTSIEALPSTDSLPLDAALMPPPDVLLTTVPATLDF